MRTKSGPGTKLSVLVIGLAILVPMTLSLIATTLCLVGWAIGRLEFDAVLHASGLILASVLWTFTISFTLLVMVRVQEELEK